MNVVLLEPEIPMNTGNIGRTCVATGTSLHLVRPLGFSTDEKSLRRSGLDYWDNLDVHYYDNFDDFMKRNPYAHIYMATTKGEQSYTDVLYKQDDYLMFGKESAGIPEEILLGNRKNAIRIPMLSPYRSLNLASSVAIILYEALRQNHLPGLTAEGALHHYRWEQN